MGEGREGREGGWKEGGGRGGVGEGREGGARAKLGFPPFLPPSSLGPLPSSSHWPLAPSLPPKLGFAISLQPSLTASYTF